MFLFFAFNFRDGVRISSRHLSLCHKALMHLVLLVSLLIIGLLLWVWVGGGFTSNYIHREKLEIYWTVLPAFLLVRFTVPRLSLLYFRDSPTRDRLKSSLKLVGNQWYWDFRLKRMLLGNLGGSIYMVPEVDLESGDFRMLEVDKVVPIKWHEFTRVVVTRRDVIHRAALPVLGIKIDAIAGRLKQQVIYPLILGKYYGQCSEICGANHRFMPICMEVTT